MVENKVKDVCPSCQKTLSNRLVDRCLYCGEDFPPSLCLPDDEKKFLKNQMLKDVERETASKGRAKNLKDGVVSHVLTAPYGGDFDSGG